MPYPPQVFSLDGHPYGLTVAGVQVIDHVPLDIAPLRWERPGEATPGGISFTIEDGGAAPALPDGHVIRYTDNVTNALLWSGVLVNRRYRRGPGHAYIEVAGTGWGMYLDRRMVTGPWSWELSASGAVNAADMVRSLVRSYGGPLEATTSAVVDEIPVTAPTAVSGDVSLRAAIGSVTAWVTGWQSSDPPQARHLYVDDDAQVHYHDGAEAVAVVGVAPCAIGDGVYTTEIRGTTGLTEYWPMHDTGSCVGLVSGTAMTHGGTWTHSTSLGVINEPGYRSVLFNGTTTVGTVASGALTGVGDWSIECWFRHPTATATHTIYSGTAASSPLIRMLSTGKLDVSLRGGASESASVTAWDDDAWHHLVVVHDAGDGGRIIVDGVDDTGPMTAQAFSASSGCTVGADVASNLWAGYLHHLAIYSAALSGVVTAGSVLLLFSSGGGGASPSVDALAHYRQGITVAPDEFVYEVGSEGVTTMAYARTYEGTAVGWVSAGSTSSGATPYWDAGPTQELITGSEPINAVTPEQVAIYEARADLYAKRPIASTSFTLEAIGGWRPGQSVSIKDARLTDGEWEAHTVSTVSGELADGNIITYRITTGAPARSLVQTVAGQE